MQREDLILLAGYLQDLGSIFFFEESKGGDEKEKAFQDTVILDMQWLMKGLDHFLFCFMFCFLLMVLFFFSLRARKGEFLALCCSQFCVKKKGVYECDCLAVEFCWSD